MDSTVALLIGKKLTGDITATEQQQLNELLEGDAMLGNRLKQLEIFWQTTVPDQPVEQEYIEKILQRIAAESQNRDSAASKITIVSSIVKRKWYYVAAAVFVVLSVAFYWQLTPAKPGSAAMEPAPHQVATKPAYRTHLELLDGTKVWLNANSRLTYGNDFNRKERVVYLIGEAFFEVKSNAQKPFVINTSKLQVHVTGTSLNVRAYPEEDRTEASLIEGSMEVRLQDLPEKVYVLEPAQKLVINHYLQELEKNDVEPKKTRSLVLLTTTPAIVPLSFDPVDSLPFETAWVFHTLAFSNETFKQVAQKMEKWFDVSIEFTSPALENIRFTGRFEDETLEDALTALKIIGKFQFSIQDKKVIISP
jgi:ferric-dicitrate binding protein FerR (iron transport regulator)